MCVQKQTRDDSQSVVDLEDEEDQKAVMEMEREVDSIASTLNGDIPINEVRGDIPEKTSKNMGTLQAVNNQFGSLHLEHLEVFRVFLGSGFLSLGIMSL